MRLALVLYPAFAGFMVTLSVVARAAAVDAGYEVEPIRWWHWTIVAAAWPVAVVYLLARLTRAALRMFR